MTRSKTARAATVAAPKAKKAAKKAQAVITPASPAVSSVFTFACELEPSEKENRATRSSSARPGSACAPRETSTPDFPETPPGNQVRELLVRP